MGLIPVEAAHPSHLSRGNYRDAIFDCFDSSTLDKIAVEIRNLQRTEQLKLQNHSKEGQIGSSAVPRKA